MLPHVVDAQGYARLFKVCKMWELEVAEQLLLAQEAAFGGGESYEAISPGASVSGDADGYAQVSTPLSSARRGAGGSHSLFIRTDLQMKPSQVNNCCQAIFFQVMF